MTDCKSPELAGAGGGWIEATAAINSAINEYPFSVSSVAIDSMTDSLLSIFRVDDAMYASISVFPTSHLSLCANTSVFLLVCHITRRHLMTSSRVFPVACICPSRWYRVPMCVLRRSIRVDGKCIGVARLVIDSNSGSVSGMSAMISWLDLRRFCMCCCGFCVLVSAVIDKGGSC